MTLANGQAPSAPEKDNELPGGHALPRLILESYRRLTDSALVPPGLEGVHSIRWLYEDAPFCVLAHDAASDPRWRDAEPGEQAASA